MKKLALIVLGIPLLGWFMLRAQVQPQIQGAGAPSNPCVNGGQEYVDTTNHVLYSCPSNGSNWVNRGLGNLTGGGGVTVSGAVTAGHVATFVDSATIQDGGAGGTGTVTSVATTSPITGGTITGTGTIACATCTTSAAALASGNFVKGSGGQAMADTGMPFFLDPSAYTWFFDDFSSGSRNQTTNTVFTTNGMGITWGLNFTGAGTTASIVTPSDAGTSGVVNLLTGATSGNFAILIAGYTISGSSITSTTFRALSATTFDVRFRAKISSTSNITQYIGFFDGTNNNRIAIRFDTGAADTTWTGQCINGGASSTAVITGSTLNTSYHNFRIRSAVAGTILFSVDGGSEVSINTNVPTVNLSPVISLQTNSNAAISTSLDYYWGWIAISR